MKLIINNLKLVFVHRKYRVIASIASLLFIWVSFSFFNYQLSVGNLWKAITYSEIVLNSIIALLFGSFLAGQCYKIQMMKGRKKAATTHGRLGGFMGILVTGCPSCSIGLASFLGLSSVVSLFPRHGLELKLLAFILLLRSNVTIYRTLLVCNVKKKK